MSHPFLLYSSDWIVLIASLAGLARRNPAACSIAMQKNDMALLHLNSGLLWTVCKQFSRPRLENTDAFERAVRHCFRNKQTKYIMGLVTLNSQIDPVKSHLLSFVYVVQTREFEIFDPNGGLNFIYQQQESTKDNRSTKFLQAYFEFDQFCVVTNEYLTHTFPIAKQVYLPMDWCPPVGIQYIEEQQNAAKILKNATATEIAHANLRDQATDFGGYCGAWSLWWLENRLKYDPAESRVAVLTKAMAKFTKPPGVPIRQWMLRYAQMLTVDTLRLMLISLRLGGRSKHRATQMIRTYARAKTYLQKHENIAYHQPHNKSVQTAAAQASKKASAYIDPILAEVDANLNEAVTRYSFGRLAFVTTH